MDPGSERFLRMELERLRADLRETIRRLLDLEARVTELEDKVDEDRRGRA